MRCPYFCTAVSHTPNVVAALLGEEGERGGGGCSAIHNGDILDFTQNYNLSKNGGS